MHAMDKRKFSPQAMAQVAETVLVAIAKQLDRKKLRRDLNALVKRSDAAFEPGVREVVAALAVVMCEDD
jgi:hypothetical protein